MLKKLKKRNEIEEKNKWAVDSLYSTDEAWQKDFDDTMAKLTSFEKYKGKLASSAEILLNCFTDVNKFTFTVEQVYVYAGLRHREDKGNSFYQGLVLKAEKLVMESQAAISFVEPEILAIDEEILNSFIASVPELGLYRQYLNNLTRLRDHVLAPEMELVLAKASELGSSPQSIFGMLNNADIKFGIVKDEDGNEIELTHGNYFSLLSSQTRQVREDAFKAYYAPFIGHKNSIAAMYAASVNKDLFFASMRKYPSSIEASLAQSNIPVEVYKNLLSTVERFLPSLHKYMDVRKKALDLQELHAYDLYVPMVKDIEMDISYEEAKDTVLKSLEPLGEEYVNIVRQGFESRWIDVYENEGKESGAFAWGVYSYHPYVMLNYNNKIRSMFTLAHEMGHAMHKYYSDQAQPYIYADHTLFVAEVASTVNEALLIEYLLKNTKDSQMTKYLINFYMEEFRATLFRQAMFAEFEMKSHEMAEHGEALTGKALNAMYRELNIKYYGNNIVIDQEIDYEWSRVPHFYRAFYVYQYSTGYSAAIALSKRILSEGRPAVEDYINFLKGGCSDYSINLLKAAGVDMSAPEPVEAALQVFASLVERFETYDNRS